MEQQIQKPIILKKRTRIEHEEGEEKGKEITITGNKRKQIEFPDHMYDNIIEHLSGKSLLRYKCVSKQLHSLISSHRFNRNHLHYNRNNPKIYSLTFRFHSSFYSVETAYELESTRQERGPTYPVPSLRTVDYDSIERVVEEQHHEPNEVSLKNLSLQFLPSNWDPFTITCCSDGIMCVKVLDCLFLWNPYTREQKKLPLPEPDKIFPTTKWNKTFGFGYDSSINDYKVVSIPSYREYPLLYRNTKNVYVMTLKSNLWRRICSDFPYLVLQNEQAISSADGNLYWLAEFPEEGEKWVLIGFDLAKEEFRQVAKPFNVREGYGYDYYYKMAMVLGLLGGCISLATHNSSCNCFDIFLLEKDDIWIKIVSFPLSLHKGPGRVENLRPLFITKDGALVMHASISFDDQQTSHQGFIYDPKEGTCKKFQVGKNLRSQVIICTKSLVSLSF